MYNMTENISHIFYINLEKRIDRRIQIEDELTKMGFKFERFNAIENTHNGLGCCYSHLKIIKTAKERGYKNVLIFEDDFIFEVSKNILIASKIASKIDPAHA